MPAAGSARQYPTWQTDTMKTITAQRRSTAPLHRILARLESREIWEHATAEATVTGSVAEGLQVRTSAPLPADEVPDSARRFLPETARIEQDFSLPATAADASSARAQQSTEVPGVPVAVSAVIDFGAADPADISGSGTEISVVAEVTSSIPLFGSAVEAAIAPTVERLLGERLEEIADL